jgi:hypothetical protein
MSRAGTRDGARGRGVTPADPSSVLIRLIEAAERTVCCRPIMHDIGELGEAVGELRSPVGAPLSRAPAVLMAVLTAMRAAPGAGSGWSVVAAALLPMLREDLTRVIEERRRPLDPDPASSYRGGA